MRNYFIGFFIAVMLLNPSTNSNATEANKKEEVEFKEYITKVMSFVKKDSNSEAKKKVLIDKIYKATHNNIESIIGRESFVILLFNESKFNNAARSPAGAIGVAQIMPAYFVEFAKDCGLKVNKDDIYDIDLNLTVGSCHFNNLLKQHKNIFVALAAYNAGTGSKTVKNMKNLENINTETSNYLSKFAYIQSLVNN